MHLFIYIFGIRRFIYIHITCISIPSCDFDRSIARTMLYQVETVNYMLIKIGLVG